MQTSDEHQYRVDVNWMEGSRGTLSSPVIPESIEVATPPEFPGGVEGVWSPEHLFTASVVSCFFTSFTAVAGYSKFDFIDLKVQSTGFMSRKDGKFVMSKVLLEPVLTISDASKEKKALRLLEKAEEICLITRSIQTNVESRPVVKITEQSEA